MITITFRREQKSIDYYKYTPFSIDTLHLYEYTGIIDINNIDSYIETNFILGHSKNYSNRILTHIYGYDKIILKYKNWGDKMMSKQRTYIAIDLKLFCGNSGV